MEDLDPYIPELEDFPPYENIDLSSYFREQIIYFFFHLTRKNDDLCIKKLGTSFRQVLQLLKKYLVINKDYYTEHLENIIKLITNTRDPIHGKGEHQLFYMLIYELYRVFPCKASYLIYRLDKFGGCWRDIKYLCQYIREHSPYGEKDGFIYICIELTNRKLAIDLDIWNSGTGSRNNISNIAKWIPREKPRFEWLFERLAIHWSNNYSYWKLDEVSIDSPKYVLALNKCKCIYRKILSGLNKYLDTTEIKQCSQRWNEIDINNVSKYTIIRQPRLFLSYYRNVDANSLEELTKEIAKIKCSQKYIEREPGSDPFQRKSKDIIQLPVSYFVKEGFRLLKGSSTNKYFKEESELLNNKWVQFCRGQTGIVYDNILPVLDISYKMLENDAETFYVGIGLSILIAQKSLFGKRILALENKPVWINLDENAQFISMIENFSEIIRSQNNTAFSFEKGVDLIANAIKESNYVCKNMKLVLFSNRFTSANMDKFYDYIENQFLILCIRLPKLIYWNLSKGGECDMPSEKIIANVSLVSGFSSSLITQIKKKNETKI